MSLHTCDDGHDDVCYEVRDCPVCDKKKDLDAANEEIETLKKKIEELEAK